jgi:hypothetical protein
MSELQHCPGCQQPKPLNRFGCCAACTKRVNAQIELLEMVEASNLPEAQSHQFHEAERRYTSIEREFTAHLAEMKRRKVKGLRLHGGWSLSQETAMRIVLGAKADRELLLQGLATYRTMVEREGGVA